MNALWLILLGAPATPASVCETEHVELVAADPELELESVCEDIAVFLDDVVVTTATAASQLGRRLEATSLFESATCVIAAPKPRCRVAPKRIVESVSIEGGLPFALLEVDLRRRVFLRTGTLLPDLDLSLVKQGERLEAYLEREGYFGSKVSVRAERQGSDGLGDAYRLVVSVDAGWSGRLVGVRIEGDRVIGAREAEALLRHDVFGIFSQRFRPEDFDPDLDRIRQRFRERGHPAARVRGRYELDEAAEKVRVVLEVNSGPRLSIELRGNEALDAEELLEVSSFESAGALDLVEAESTAKAMHELYQKEGFDQAEVMLEGAALVGDTFVVSYRIREGPRRSVASIRVEGVPTDLVEAAELVTRSDGVLSSGRYVDAWVERDARSLERTLTAAGHPSAKVVAEKRARPDGRIEVVFRAQSVPARRVGAVRFEGLPPGLAADAILGHLRLAPGAPYVEASLVSDQAEVLASLAELGYHEAQVEQRQQGDDLYYEVTPGLRRSFAGVLIRGGFRTVDSVVERALAQTPGEPLNLLALSAGKRRLRRLGILSSVEVEPLSTADPERTWLLVNLKEADVATLDLVASFTTDDLFAVGLDFRDRNLLGRALRLDLGGRFANAAELGTDLRIGRADRLSGVLGIPAPFGAPFDLETALELELENREVLFERRVGGRVSMLRTFYRGQRCELCPELSGSLSYELSDTLFEPRGDGPPIARDELSLSGNFGRVVPRLRFDWLDHPLDPRRGLKTELRFEVAHRGLSPFSNGGQFWRLQSSLAGFVPLGRPFELSIGRESRLGGPMVLALGATFGTAGVYGADGSLPLSESYFYGGDQSVRGLARRASAAGKPGATSVFVGSAELRWYLLPDLPLGALQLAGFADVGVVSYALGELFEFPTLSAGPALRWVTAVGPLSAAYGWPLIVDPSLGTEVAPPSGRLHITFGYSF